MAVISSPCWSAVSTCGVSPGRRWNSSKGIVRSPIGPCTCTVASSAASATAASEGCTAMQWSLVPRMACQRFTPPRAAQPLPGARLLQAKVTSRK